MKKRGVDAALFFACKIALASRLMPTFDRVLSVGMRLPVGASLLAKGPTQTTKFHCLATTSRHTFAFNLFLTRHFQTLDRISRYFKAKFSALIR
jgi:hypothetical protein